MNMSLRTVSSFTVVVARPPRSVVCGDKGGGSIPGVMIGVAIVQGMPPGGQDIGVPSMVLVGVDSLF